MNKMFVIFLLSFLTVSCSKDIYKNHRFSKINSKPILNSSFNLNSNYALNLSANIEPGNQCYQKIKKDLFDINTIKPYLNDKIKRSITYQLLTSKDGAASLRSQSHKLFYSFSQTNDDLSDPHRILLDQQINFKLYRNNKVLARTYISFSMEEKLDKSNFVNIDYTIVFYGSDRKVKLIEEFNFELDEDNNRCDLKLESYASFKYINSNKVEHFHHSIESNLKTTPDYISLPNGTDLCSALDDTLLLTASSKKTVQCFLQETNEIETLSIYKKESAYITYISKFSNYFIKEPASDIYKWIHQDRSILINSTTSELSTVRVDSTITKDSISHELNTTSEYVFYGQFTKEFDPNDLIHYFKKVIPYGKVITDGNEYYKYQFTYSPKYENELVKNLNESATEKTFTSDVSSQFYDELSPTNLYDFEHPRIQSIINQIKEKTSHSKSRVIIVQTILKFLKNSYTYDYDIRESNNINYRASDLINNKTFVCGHYSTLFVALARGLGIPARKVGGLHIEERGEAHGWVEVILDGNNWFPLEPQSTILRLAPYSALLIPLEWTGSNQLLYNQAIITKKEPSQDQH